MTRIYGRRRRAVRAASQKMTVTRQPGQANQPVRYTANRVVKLVKVYQVIYCNHGGTFAISTVAEAHLLGCLIDHSSCQGPARGTSDQLLRTLNAPPPHGCFPGTPTTPRGHLEDCARGPSRRQPAKRRAYRALTTVYLKQPSPPPNPKPLSLQQPTQMPVVALQPSVIHAIDRQHNFLLSRELVQVELCCYARLPCLGVQHQAGHFFSLSVSFRVLTGTDTSTCESQSTV